MRNRGSGREQRQRRSAAESVGERDGEKGRNETVGDPKKPYKRVEGGRRRRWCVRKGGGAEGASNSFTAGAIQQWEYSTNMPSEPIL